MRGGGIFLNSYISEVWSCYSLLFGIFWDFPGGNTTLYGKYLQNGECKNHQIWADYKKSSFLYNERTRFSNLSRNNFIFSKMLFSRFYSLETFFFKFCSAHCMQHEPILAMVNYYCYWYSRSWDIFRTVLLNAA